MSRPVGTLVCLLVLVAGCGGKDSDKGVAPVGGRPQPDSSSSRPDARLGEPVPLPGGQITVLEVADRARPTGDAPPLRANQHWVRVRARVENLGADVFAGAAAEFALGDSRGRRFLPARAQVFAPALGAFALSPGEQALGYVAFQVLDGTRLERVEFTAAGEQVSWAIG